METHFKRISIKWVSFFIVINAMHKIVTKLINKYVILFLFGVPTPLFAQLSLCGKIEMEFESDTESTHGWVITLENLTDSSILTNNSPNKEFCFSGLRPGEYLIYAEYKNQKSAEVLVSLYQSVSNIELNANRIYELDEVVVYSKSKKDIKKEHSIKTDIVDMEAQRLTSTTVEDLMNNTPGVKVRNSNGIGGESDIVVGGFSGKSVKFLIDGIPIDYLGSSMGITKIPTSVASYIEVYKGVLPTEIGVDALGAAVNIVAKNPNETSSQFSYRIGSFNTHQVTLNTFIRSSKKISFGINAFGNYSTNNFKVSNLPYENITTGKVEMISAQLFHNRYWQFNGEAFINLEERKWADLFKITVNSYSLSKQLQNDFASRNRPYGKVAMKEYAYAVPSILYKKIFFDNKLITSQFLVFSNIENQLIDTLKNAYYDWLGNRHENVSGSETGVLTSNLKESIARTQTSNLTYRGLFNYHFNSQHKLTLNLINMFLHREADDMGNYDSRTNVNYNRFIVGLGYQYHLLDQRLEGMTQVKILLSGTRGNLNNVLIGTEESNHKNMGVSLAQSLKYQTENGWIFRSSVENTYRLPDQMEVFGDNVFILPNISLKPERSFNVNAGLGYQLNKKFHFEVNAYYRDVKDMIKLKEVTQFQANYLNLDKVRGYGIELEAEWEVVDGLDLSGNLTYNEFRFRGSNDKLSQNDHFINARVSNMPFYFGNANISYQTKRLFSKKDNLKLYWSYSYVHQFYLDFIEKKYEPDGFLGLYGKSKIYTNRIIPVQHINSCGFVWQFQQSKVQQLALSTELNNIFNTRIFNDFKMQSPGRSFYVKVSYDF